MPLVVLIGYQTLAVPGIQRDRNWQHPTVSEGPRLDLQLCSGGSVAIPSSNPYQQSGEWVTQFSAVTFTILFRSWVKKAMSSLSWSRNPKTSMYMRLSDQVGPARVARLQLCKRYNSKTAVHGSNAIISYILRLFGPRMVVHKTTTYICPDND